MPAWHDENSKYDVFAYNSFRFCLTSAEVMLVAGALSYASEKIGSLWLSVISFAVIFSALLYLGALTAELAFRATGRRRLAPWARWAMLAPMLLIGGGLSWALQTAVRDLVQSQAAIESPVSTPRT